jgi:biopolymer transport protein ExbB
MQRTVRTLLLALGLAWGGQVAPLVAQDQPTTAKVATKAAPKASRAARPTSEVGRQSVLKLVRQANPMLWPLGLCSIVTLGFALERFLALRRSRVIPRDFVTRFHEKLAGGNLNRDRALELCRANDSPASRIFGHVVRYWGQPAVTIRQGVSHDAAGELLDLRRNVRVLNGTATLAPLLGLLGTVIGLIESFDALGGRTSGGMGKSEALAHGISLALMATAFGLFIAIISVVLYYYFLNRIDLLVRELDDQARQVIDLVAAEAGRPLADRRVMPGPNDHARHESRPVG